MKVNISMEGTPQEIAECLRQIGQQSNVTITPIIPSVPKSPTTTIWPPHYIYTKDIICGDLPETVGSGSTNVKSKGCPSVGPCFCTGACTRQASIDYTM